MGEVDVGGLGLEDGKTALGVVVALLEGGEGVQGVSTEPKGGGETGPVNLCGCVAL